MVDKTAKYRQAVCKVLSNLNLHYKDHPWRGADSYADSIEGAICLFNRERIASVEDWLDSEIRDMWRPQRGDGVVEGWHGDGNSARTSIMYALLKTQGLYIRPWRADVRIGAVVHGRSGKLCISLIADKPWKGKILFDKPRHKTQMHLPLDYPRINHFPEWFTVTPNGAYTVQPLSGKVALFRSGKPLLDGIPIDLPAGREVRMTVSELRNTY